MKENKTKSKSPKKPASRKTTWALALVVMVVLLAVGGLGIWSYDLVQELDDNESTSVSCTDNDKLMEEAAVADLTLDGESFEVIAEQIRQIPDYETDPSCLYALTLYHLTNGDSVNALSSYEQFQATGDEGKARLNDNLASTTTEEIEGRISFHQQQLESPGAHGWSIEESGEINFIGGD